ncbi:YbeD family protein [Granulosicoccus sp. 3-233]|uniref:YbeD family protein n=1 Tax=Granulosicoccus sp. 3-233 TaxID=3417969 RepID=UPI003D359551
MSSETLIEFPADIVVKAMGLNEGDFEALVSELVRPHVEPEAVSFTAVPSKEGKYLSVRAHFTATSHEHLLGIYAALKAEERVLYTL